MPYHVAMSYHVSNPCHAIMSYRVTMPPYGMPCHHAIPFMQNRAIMSYHVIRGYIVTMPYHVIMSYPLVMPYHASIPGRVIMPYHAIPCRSCHAMPYRAQCRGQVGHYLGQRAPARAAQSTCDPPLTQQPPWPKAFLLSGWKVGRSWDRIPPRRICRYIDVRCFV